MYIYNVYVYVLLNRPINVYVYVLLNRNGKPVNRYECIYTHLWSLKPSSTSFHSFALAGHCPAAARRRMFDREPPDWLKASHFVLKEYDGLSECANVSINEV